jgi:hypothetical protein
MCIRVADTSCAFFCAYIKEKDICKLLKEFGVPDGI